MVANLYWLAALTGFVQIDAMSEYLRAVSSERTERSHPDLIGAVDKMTICNRSMPLNSQVRLAPGVQFEVAASGSKGKRGDPVERADAPVLIEPKQFKSFTHGERTNVRLGPHLQAGRQYKRESGDEGALVDLESAKDL
jgi:hypothetical protein